MTTRRGDMPSAHSAAHAAPAGSSNGLQAAEGRRQSAQRRWECAAAMRHAGLGSDREAATKTHRKRCSGDGTSAAGETGRETVVLLHPFPFRGVPGSMLASGGKGLRSQGGCCRPHFRQANGRTPVYWRQWERKRDAGLGPPWHCGCRAHSTQTKTSSRPLVPPSPFDLSRGIDLPSTAPKQKMLSSVLSPPGAGLEPFSLDPGFWLLFFFALAVFCLFPWSQLHVTLLCT